MNQPASHSFPLRRLAVLVSTMGAGQVILLTLVPLISALCGLSIASLGGLVALGTACFMLAAPVWGGLSDRLGRKPVLIAGVLGILLAQSLFTLFLLLLAAGTVSTTQGLWALGMSRLVYGLFGAAIYPACQAWAVDNSVPARRLAVLSNMSAAANLGRMLGPVLALPGLGLAWLGLGELWALVWLPLLPAASLLLLLPMPGGARSPVVEPVLDVPRLNLPIFALCTVALLATVAIGQLQIMLGPVLGDFYALDAVTASSVTAWLLLGVAVISVAVQLGFVRRVQAPRSCLVLGAGLLLVGISLLWWQLGSLRALAGLVVFVMGVACIVPAYTSLLSEQGGGRLGRAFGFLTLMHTAGYTIGFAVGGWGYTASASQPLLGLLLAVLLMGVAVLMVLLSPRRQDTYVVGGAGV